LSSETSSSLDTARSASETRQEIADYVLKHTDELSDVPCVKIFVDEHGRLTKEIAEAKARQERLAKAKEEYEPLEQRVGPCRLALNDAERELAKLYAPLGEAAFKAMLTDDIDEQPLFADRLAAHKQVQVLQAESDALLPGADAGMVQKTKAKAKQLAIKAKIKLAERKFGGLQTEIGRKIVEDELDESIQCDPTNQLLSQIKDQRDGIASLSAELKEAESELAESGKRLCKTVGLASIGRSKDLDTAIKLGTKTIKQHDSDVATATHGLADTLKEVDASTLPNTLVPLLESLGNAPADGFAGRFKESRRTGVEAVASAKKYWSGLSLRKRNQIVGGVAVAVILLGVFFFRGGDTPSTTNRVSGETAEQAAEPTAEEPTEQPQPVPSDLPIIELPSITNTLDMEFNKIPTGTFLMGSPESREGRHTQVYQHQVTISKAFYMQTTEVTKGQWKAVMGTEPWYGKNFKFTEGPDYAATYVSWQDAIAFCEKLSEKESNTYRLPTEAEWEYACRAGTKTIWSFGNDEKALADYAWCKENAADIDERYAHQVGLKKPNAFGLYDMHGNVYEWCDDYYGEDNYKSSPEKDPTDRSRNTWSGDSGGSFRVLRGGSWNDGPRAFRSFRFPPWSGARRDSDRGFRLVRELD
jgi:formylglycine-generating enzyme required for sulfatase activity